MFGRKIFGGILGGGNGLQQDPSMKGEWENSFPTMQQPQDGGGKGFFSQGTADKLSSVAQGLAAAGAFGAGDYDEGASILGNMSQLAQAPRLAEQKRATALSDHEAKARIDAQYRQPSQPHRWERNDGSLMEVGADGLPREVYRDPTPKMNFIPDGMGGGQWVAVPGAAPVQDAVPERPVGKLTPYTGGGAGNGTGGFHSYRR